MSIVSQIFSFVQGAFVAAAKRRRQRLVLVDVMRLGPARLEALGVDVFAVREALTAKPAAGAREVVKLGCEQGFASHA
jgi:hypothetical protein